jgi:hypothetical protein
VLFAFSSKVFWAYAGRGNEKKERRISRATARVTLEQSYERFSGLGALRREFDSGAVQSK